MDTQKQQPYPEHKLEMLKTALDLVSRASAFVEENKNWVSTGDDTVNAVHWLKQEGFAIVHREWDDGDAAHISWDFTMGLEA